MGTATVTRSQGRKTRSASKAELKDRDLPSPLHGRNIGNSSKRPMAKSSAICGSVVDKENSLPSSIRLDANTDIQGDPALLRVIKKRKETSLAPPSRSESAKDTRLQAAAFSTRSESAKDVVLQTAAEASSAGLLLLDLHEMGSGSQSMRSMEANTLPATMRSMDANTLPATNQVENPSLAGLVQGNIATGDILQSGGIEVVREATASYAAKEPGMLLDQQSKDPGPSKAVGLDQNLASSDSVTGSLLSLVQKDYEKLYKKYQKLKARRFDEVDTLLEEQKARITAYIKATEDLVAHYKGENSYLRQQIQETDIPEILNRNKLLEKAVLECKNDLLLEQSKNLELGQENKRLKSLLLEHVAAQQSNVEVIRPADKTADDAVTGKTSVEDETERVMTSQSKLVHQLLQQVLGLQLSFSCEAENAPVQFRHGPTGFSFNLRAVNDSDVAEVVGGGELLYENISLGLCKKAVDWMKEEQAVFAMSQAQLFFKKLLRFIQQGA